MLLVTDIPQADELFRRSFLTDHSETSIMSNTQLAARSKVPYYLVTCSDFEEKNPFRNDYVLLSTDEPLSIVDKQFSLVSLSQAMFKNARPLEGEGLAILNDTYSKFFSKTPTRL
jgi:hypothetical protein